MKTFLTKTVSLVLVLVMLCGIVPMTKIEVEAANYVVNGITIPLAGKTVGTPWGYTDCWNFAQQVYNTLWGTSFSSYRGTSDDMLRQVATGTDRAINVTNTKNFIGMAALGATIRVVDYIDGNDGQGTYMHSMILIQKDSAGFTIYDSWAGAVRIKYYTWSGFVSDFASHKYFKYIKWPGAPLYSSAVSTTGISLNTNSGTVDIGETVKLTATVSPSNATNKTVTWSSNDTSVATVSGGTVKGIKPGVVTITAKSSGGQTATAIVIVRNKQLSPVSDSTYNGHYYELYDDVLSWKDAKEYYESLGGYLVTITSAVENDFVQNLAEKGNRDHVYIGATDESAEGTWKWVSGEKFSYINFADGEPSANGYEEEDYIRLNASTGMWHDIKNVTDSVGICGFICEYDYIAEPTLPDGADPDDYEKVTEYRYRDKQTTTSTASSMSGWTLYDSDVTYGSWSSTKTTNTKPTTSDTLQITGTSTKYKYYHYWNYYGGCNCIDSISYGTNKGYCEIYLTYQLGAVSMEDQGGKQAYGSYTCGNEGFNYWFYGGTVTTYSYQTRTKTTTNHFYKYGDWSAWGTTPVTATSNRQVETRTVYKLKDHKHKSSSWIIDKKATVNAAGKKHKECTECGKILETATIAQLKCSKPTLKSISNKTSGVKITWGKVSGADSYRVYRKTKNGSWKYLGSTSKTGYTDKTAKSGTKYYYAVRARNEAGNSSLSSSKSIYHLADTTLSTPKSTKSGITLKWKKVTGADGYMVYRKTGSGSYSKIATVKGNSKVTYTDKKAKKGKTYTYKIKVYKSKTYSAYSNAKKIKDKY